MKRNKRSTAHPAHAASVSEERAGSTVLRPKTILIAPLNWGLGHATRCMPIIDELQRQGARVIIASDGRALRLLEKEYPDLLTLELPPYNIRYGTGSMVWNMAWQMPKILRAIWREQRAVEKIIREYQVDALISDNRFGCWSASISSVFLTHQIHLKVPTLLGLGTFAKWNNRRLIQRYDECWIPDVEGEPNLSGTLSHGRTLPNTRYVGVLSRMEKMEVEKRYDIIAVLSGPEPQRTFFEEKIIEQLEKLSYSALIVKGKTDSDTRSQNNRIHTVAYLTKNDLNEAMLASDIVITRSGYSTLMDLAALQKRQVILVPTPGQTEQEYLAERFHEQNIFFTQHQNELDLEVAIRELPKFTGLDMEVNQEKLRDVVSDFLLMDNG